MPIDIRVLNPGDDSVLANVAPKVFDKPIDANLTREFLEDSRHHIAVALDEGLVVGFASAVHYLHPDKPPELWINEVGVAPTHRRRGLGRALLNALFTVGLNHKCGAAWVLTDRSNASAMSLYAGSGGTVDADKSRRSKGLVMFTFQLARTRRGGQSD